MNRSNAPKFNMISGVFSCGICSDERQKNGGEKLTYVKYFKLQQHLASEEHQVIARKRLASRVLQNLPLPLDETRYVLVEYRKLVPQPQFHDSHLYQLGVWLSSFGVVTELLNLERCDAILISLQFIGNWQDERDDKESAFLKQQEYNGNMVRIFKKCLMTEADWTNIKTGAVKKELGNQLNQKRQRLRQGKENNPQTLTIEARNVNRREMAKPKGARGQLPQSKENTVDLLERTPAGRSATGDQDSLKNHASLGQLPGGKENKTYLPPAQPAALDNKNRTGKKGMEFPIIRKTRRHFQQAGENIRPPASSIKTTPMAVFSGEHLEQFDTVDLDNKNNSECLNDVKHRTDIPDLKSEEVDSNVENVHQDLSKVVHKVHTEDMAQESELPQCVPEQKPEEPLALAVDISGKVVELYDQTCCTRSETIISESVSEPVTAEVCVEEKSCDLVDGSAEGNFDKAPDYHPETAAFSGEHLEQFDTVDLDNENNSECLNDVKNRTDIPDLKSEEVDSNVENVHQDLSKVVHKVHTEDMAQESELPQCVPEQKPEEPLALAVNISGKAVELYDQTCCTRSETIISESVSEPVTAEVCVEEKSCDLVDGSAEGNFDKAPDYHPETAAFSGEDMEPDYMQYALYWHRY